jgi:hypothetical protein
LHLAERGVRLSNGLWVREVRQRFEKSGHQNAIISTDYQADLSRVAVAMFARWCLENFFKYMPERYSIDHLIEYGTEALPDTTRVANPAWREVDSQIRRLTDCSIVRWLPLATSTFPPTWTLPPWPSANKKREPCASASKLRDPRSRSLTQVKRSGHRCRQARHP